MKPAPFDYLDPRSLPDALAALAQHGDDAKVLAGGQSLVPMLNLRLARPAALVDINRVPGLDGLEERGGVLHAGALVRHRRLERWASGRVPLLAAALELVGHAAIRTRGTAAGSLAHADPAAELPALLLCLGGSVVAARTGGERVIAAEALFEGPLATSLAADELITETQWPLPSPGDGWSVQEVARRHGDFALVGVVALLALRAGRLADVRIAIFGAAPTARRARAAEQALAGQPPTASLLTDAGRAAAADLDPPGDLHATPHYRRTVAATLVTRALTEALGRAKEAR